jgi:hypothetical protein
MKSTVFLILFYIFFAMAGTFFSVICILTSGNLLIHLLLSSLFSSNMSEEPQVCEEILDYTLVDLIYANSSFVYREHQVVVFLRLKIFIKLNYPHRTIVDNRMPVTRY